MYGKLKITGKIELVTGLHIGGPSPFSAIGAVDSPIVKDVRNGNPVIPGSSLKGKLRTLLAKKYNESPATKPDDDNPKLTSLFGSSKKGDIKTGRLIFSDMTLANWEEMKKEGLTSKTEVKWENTISRSTAEANPRQIERAIRGSKFDLDIVYDVISKEEMIQDFEILKEGFKILQYDYLGGSGTRGYGKVKFTDLLVCLVVGDSSELTETVNKCQEILDELGKQQDGSDNK
ncbi:CRISPR type III-A/MTUBE-associated RAMP protein Csm3 [Peptostreptococcaceae bacterium AS15]|nr:CRISPR type III-A/MTUBE-associated RAMP protein Csm3 [Peptostreptococcaceae bacterium AS15]